MANSKQNKCKVGRCISNQIKSIQISEISFAPCLTISATIDRLRGQRPDRHLCVRCHRDCPTPWRIPKRMRQSTQSEAVQETRMVTAKAQRSNHQRNRPGYGPQTTATKLKCQGRHRRPTGWRSDEGTISGRLSVRAHVMQGPTDRKSVSETMFL